MLLPKSQSILQIGYNAIGSLFLLCFHFLHNFFFILKNENVIFLQDTKIFIFQSLLVFMKHLIFVGRFSHRFRHAFWNFFLQPHFFNGKS